MHQQQKPRGGERRESADVRRLAAQLGISSRVLLLDDGGSPTREQQQQSQPASSYTTGEERDDHATPSASPPAQHEDGVSQEEDADELEESLDQYELESCELPDSLVLASDSNSLSASESVSSELSLPRSFGRYDGVRSAVGGVLPVTAAGAKRRSPFSGISHFDDHLMHFPTGPPRKMAAGSSATSVPVLAPTPQTGSTKTQAPGSDVMKKFYEVQVEKVRSQLVLATQAQRQLEKTLQEERAAWSSKVNDAEVSVVCLADSVELVALSYCAGVGCWVNGCLNASAHTRLRNANWSKRTPP